MEKSRQGDQKSMLGVSHEFSRSEGHALAWTRPAVWRERLAWEIKVQGGDRW